MSRPSKRATPSPEHPWERNRRAAFERWELELRRTPYGRPLPDVVGFANPIVSPPKGRSHTSPRRWFALTALPTGSGPAYWVRVPARFPVPPAGGVVRLPQPTKTVLTSSAGPWGELLLEARHGVTQAGWEELLPGVDPESAANVVPTLSDLWGLPPSVTEAILLPVVGSTPWHARPAGVDLHFEVEGWSLRRHHEFLQGLLRLVPRWVVSPSRSARSILELETRAGWRVQAKARGVVRPFAVETRPVSGPPVGPKAGGNVNRSTIRYGNSLRSEFVTALETGTLTVLLSAALAGRIPRQLPEPPEGIRSTVWGLHWWTPEAPDAPDWHRWVREEEPRLRDAFGEIPPGGPGSIGGMWDATLDRRNLQDRLVQIAIAHARLRAASEVESSDFHWAVDSCREAVRTAVALARAGKGPFLREFDRTEGARTGRLRKALESLLQLRVDGLSVPEAMAALGSSASEWEVENQLERLRIRGVLFQDRSGRYRLVG